jgi:predicted nucleic acid-binding Zn ribbon protein
VGWTSLPDRDGPAPVPLREALEAVIGGLGAPSVDAVVLVHDRWADVVGDEVAPHATIVGIDGSRLVVAADGPAWASHLRWAEPEIVERIRAILGRSEIDSITVRVSRR